MKPETEDQPGTVHEAEFVEQLPAIPNLLEEQLPPAIRERLFSLAEQIRLLCLLGTFIKQHGRTFDRLQVVPSTCTNNVDLDGLEREKVVEVLREFPGTWKKATANGRLHYVLDVGNGINLRMYNAALPPGCTLIKKKRVVPKHEEEFFEMNCGQPKAEPDAS